MDKEKSPPHEPPPQPLQPHPPPQEQRLQHQQHRDQQNNQQQFRQQPLSSIAKLSQNCQLVIQQQKPPSSIILPTTTSLTTTASPVKNYEFLDLTDVDDSERKYLTTTLFTSTPLSTNVKTTPLSASYLAIKKTKNLKKIQNFNNSYYYQQQPQTQQQQQIPAQNRSINKNITLPLINSIPQQQQQCNNNWIFLNSKSATTAQATTTPVINTTSNVATTNINVSPANLNTFIKLNSDNEILPSFDDQSTTATNITPAVISTLKNNNNLNIIVDTNLNNSVISTVTPANSKHSTTAGEYENVLIDNICPTAPAVLNSSTSTSWHEQPYGWQSMVAAPTIYQQQHILHHSNDQQSKQQQRQHHQQSFFLPHSYFNLIRNELEPRIITPFTKAVPLFYTNLKPVRTQIPLLTGINNSSVTAPTIASISSACGVAVNGNFDSTTPSEAGTESSSITTDQQSNHNINNTCNSVEIGQFEKRSLLTASSDTIEIIDDSLKEGVVINMSPHVTNQQIQHQQQQHHQNNMPATPPQQGNGNNGGGNGPQMYNHQIVPSGYITPTSHGGGAPTMYQMLPPNLPSNVYVSNVPGNANMHNYMTSQGIPQYAFGPHTYITADEQQQQQQQSMQHQHHQHLQQHHHHHQQQQNIPNNARGGSRRGRGRGNGGNRREYMPRQHQNQEIMSPIIESQPVMGPSGYTQYYVSSFPPYYAGGPPAPMGHPNAQHATGSPLYLNHMPMYAAGAPIYGYPPNVMYPTTMIPPEFAMVDDKNEDHGSESGSMTPVPNMWHPHISLDYASLEHGGVHIIDPQHQSQMDDYLSQENLDEAQGLLQPISSPSPMHHHGMPQHSQHILNPNVATFKHIPSGEIIYHHPHIHHQQQLHQQHQQQSMTQQMAEYGINSISPIDALSPVPNHQQLSGSGSMISLTPTPTPPPQHIIHGSPSGIAGNNQTPYLVTGIQQEQHGCEPVVLINHNNDIMQHPQMFLNNQQRTATQPMTIIDNNIVMYQNQQPIEQADCVANEQINNYNNLVNNNNIKDDITVIHEVPSETLVMDTNNNNNNNVTVTTNINSNKTNNLNYINNNNNSNDNVNNSINIKVVPNSVFINNVNSNNDSNNNNNNHDNNNNNNNHDNNNNHKINDNVNKIIKATQEKLTIKTERILSKPPGWSAKKQTQSVAVTAIPSAVAAATAAAAAASLVSSTIPMVVSNKQQETKLLLQQPLVSSLTPQPPLGGIQSRQRISPPPFATNNNKVNYIAPQQQHVKLNDVINNQNISASTEKPLTSDIINVDQNNGEVQNITGMIPVVQYAPSQQQSLIQAVSYDNSVKTVESKQVEAIPQRVDRNGAKSNGIVSSVDILPNYALDNKLNSSNVTNATNNTTINKDSPTMATVTATATPDDILKDTTAAAIKAASTQVAAVQSNNSVLPVVIPETITEHTTSVVAPAATISSWAGLFTARKSKSQQGQPVAQVQTLQQANNTTSTVSQSSSANLPLSAVIGTPHEPRKPTAKLSPFANNLNNALTVVNPPNPVLNNNSNVPITASAPTAVNLITPGVSYSAASSKGLKNVPTNVTLNSGITMKQSNAKSQLQQKPTNDEFSYKMGDFLHKYHIDNNSVSLLPRGLTNRSNYCYINSILQALVNCPPFYNLIRSITSTTQYRSTLKSQNTNTTATPIIDAMVELVKEFSLLPVGARLNRREKGQKKDDSSFDISSEIPFEPNVVYKMLNGIRSDMFQIEGRQEDAEEFLGCILNGLNDEMLELIKLVNKPPPPIIHNGDTNSDSNNDDGDDWQIIYGNRNKGAITRKTDYGRTPISDIFRGQLRSRLQRDGEPTTDVVQPFFTLQLDIEKAQSVKEALEILVGRDQLEGVTCSKTNQEVAAWQQVSLEELPVVLILHLKWFDYKLDGCTKILKTVEFPIELKIDSKLMSAKIKYSQKQKQYKLFAIVYHDGKEASKGHYITDVYNVGYGSWMRYDDSIVKPINEQNVLHPRVPRVPYLLYYRRCDTIGPQNQQQNNK